VVSPLIIIIVTTTLYHELCIHPLNMPPQTQPKAFHCPFNCGRNYTRLEKLKNHLQTNKYEPDERHSRTNTEIWAKVAEDGLDTWQKRPGNLTEGEKKDRRKVVSSKYRLEHRDEIYGSRRQRKDEINQGLRLAKRAAKIVIEARNSTLSIRVPIRQNLFKTALPDNPQLKPLADFMDPTKPATFETFSALVATYLSPSKWPKVVSIDQLPEGDQHPHLIVDQLPGVKEYHTLCRLLHPDRGETQQTTPGHYTRQRRRGGLRIDTTHDSALDPQLNGGNGLGVGNSDPDHAIKPSTGMAAMLNSAWDIWKDVMMAEHIRTASFVKYRDNEPEFIEKSHEHGIVLGLLNTWCQHSMTVVNALTIQGFSLAQVEHFVNDSTMPPPDLLLEDYESSEYEEDDDSREAEESRMWKDMSDLDILKEVLNLEVRKRPGPKKKTPGDSPQSST
jgi:hypothetical protein